ncbi:intradiol ring-cleavage dioxygenase [Gramella sp. BOM4]|nr:intradiol ring-cleavage dioxygenase [Christiangramia bathymodioli]
MKSRISLFIIYILLLSCVRSQENKDFKLVGGPCEGCEAVLEFSGKLNSVDTLPDFKSAKNKLKITGTIYKPDGKTPAENVILYIHHTNAEGVYPTRGDEEGWAARHGYLRGWIKTGKDGHFTFYTQIPGSYPDGKTPAHIHPIILEPNGNYYYLSGYFFKGDPLLSEHHIEDPPRGSKGVVSLEKDGELAIIERNFILGRGVPDYQE